MTSAARDLMDTGTPGPWTKRTAWSVADALHHEDARKIVLSVNALPLVANYDDAVMAYLRHQTACQHGPGCVTLSTLWTALTAARDALEAALRGEGE